MSFNLNGTTTDIARTTLNLVLGGVNMVVGQAVSASHALNHATDGASGEVIATNTIRINHLSLQANTYSASGLVELNAKPTFVE